MSQGTTNPYLCSLLWKHICVRAQNQLQPCCSFKEPSNVILKSGRTVDLNTPYMQTLREQALQQVPISGCSSCYNEERLTGSSLRTKSNILYPMTGPIDKHTDPSQIEYIEIFLGSKCNLRCFSCSPTLSSAILKDYQDLGWKTQSTQVFDDWDYTFLKNFKNLKRIKFVGGEPLLNKSHDAVISVLADMLLDDIELDYFTNGTIFPPTKTLDVWSKSKKVFITFSIDGIGKRNEYLRSNSSWSLIEKNIKRYFSWASSRKNFVFQTSATVSSINILFLNEIESWFQALSNDFPSVKTEAPFFVYLTDPPFLSPHSAPQDVFRKMEEKFSSQLSQQYKKVLSTAISKKTTNQSYNKRIFWSYMEPLQKLRELSLESSFPEIASFYL